MVCAFSTSTYSVLYSGSRSLPPLSLVTVPFRLVIRQVYAPPLFLLLFAGSLSFTYFLISSFLYFSSFPAVSFSLSLPRKLVFYFSIARSLSLSLWFSLTLSIAFALSLSVSFSFPSRCLSLSLSFLICFPLAPRLPPVVFSSWGCVPGWGWGGGGLALLIGLEY